MTTDAARPLAGSRVLITGAASGIGRAVACDFAQAGAELVLADCNADGLTETTNMIGCPAEHLIYDAAQPGASTQMARAASRDGLDGVINIAGIYARAYTADLSAQDWARVLTVNLTSVFEICQAAIPALADSGRGKIVNTSSTAGLRGIAYASHYAAAKAGIIGLTRALAVELAPQNIRANVIVPGMVQTDIIRNLTPITPPGPAQAPRTTRLPGFEGGATPEAITAAYRYFGSEASQYVTGTVHVMDGGAGLG